ncbi:MAG: asparagine synthase (glutamine-hydrolyzing) [Alphaproteobacteria bacterium]
MCGIAGFLDPRRRWSPQDSERIAASMAAEMVHRGPDDAGAHAEPESDLAFGFRRLAIVDLTEAGHQPMVSASGRSVIVYNGEIYNADDLRRDLAARGIRFRGHSDTEVLLEACEAWGIDATLSRLIGMFAFAVFDRTTRRLSLARDRLGKKPLYLAQHGGAVLFGSELRALRAHPLFEAVQDDRALSAFLRYGWVPAPLCIYKDIEQLPPGGIATISPDGMVRVERWWRADDIAAAAKAKPLEGSDGELLDRLDDVLKDAVRRRLVADVPLGAFLSGGIDSSLIVALMQEVGGGRTKTFSIGFEEAAFDESPHARAVARHLGTDHHELHVSSSEALATVPDLPEVWDEPFADSSQIPTLLVSRLARQQVTVALSGDGGDEIFAGYSRYAQMAAIMRIVRRTPGAVRWLAQLGHGLVTAPALAPLHGLLPPLLHSRAERWLGRIAAIDGVEIFEPGYRRMLQRGLEPALIFPRAEEVQEPLWSGQLARSFPGVRERCQMLDTLSYLPDDILVKVDRATMAASLEARAPLLDHRVFDMAWCLPDRMKMRDGIGKWALRELLYRRVPRQLVDRPKMGFGVPIDRWLRGPLRDWAEDLLDARRLSQGGVLDAGAVGKLWQRHLSGQNWQYPLWCILMAEAWRRRWL